MNSVAVLMGIQSLGTMLTLIARQWDADTIGVRNAWFRLDVRSEMTAGVKDLRQLP